MKKLYVTLILFLFSNFVFGQIVFQKTYGDSLIERGIAAQITNDGGYIITGATWSYGVSRDDVYLLKTDSAGNVQWMKTYGGNLNDEGASVQQTDDGGYIVCGGTQTSVTGYGSKIYLIKTDSNGDTLWTKMYGSSTDLYWSHVVRQTSDHGYIITVVGDNGIGSDWRLMKTDSAGNFLWKHGYFGHGERNPVLQTSDGGFIAMNYDWSSCLVRTTSNGTLLWTKMFTQLISGNYGYLLYDLGKTNDGGFILAGEYRNLFGISGCYLVKTDSLGDTLWTKAYLTYLKQTSATSVQQTLDGGYVIAGYTVDSTNGDHSDAFLLRTDSSGNVIWMRKYGGAGNEAGYAVEQAADGGFMIAGSTDSYGAGSADIYLIKTDSMGVGGCNDSLLNPVVIIPYVQISSSNFSYTDSILTGHRQAIVNSAIPQQTILCGSSVNIEENSFNDKMSYKLFPNPFTNDISITIQKQYTYKASFAIKNVLGQTVFTFSNPPKADGKGSCTLDLDFLSKGIYLLEATVDDEHVVKKIVKE